MSLVTFAVAPLPPGPPGETPYHALGWEGPGGLALICLFAHFQGLQSQEEEDSPHRKKREQEIVYKGMVK